jgi:hypothetical protein
MQQRRFRETLCNGNEAEEEQKEGRIRIVAFEGDDDRVSLTEDGWLV